MSHAIATRSSDANVVALAEETDTSTDVVQALYEQEIAALIEQARITQFVSVIATRLVRQRLRDLRANC